MGYNLIYWTPVSDLYLGGGGGFYFGKNVEKCGKMAVFPGGYGRIGDIPHGQIWPN